MSVLENLSMQERQEMERVLERLLLERGYASYISPENLIRSWHGLIDGLEKGYRGLPVEYEDDLVTRRVLEELSLRLSPPLQEKLAEAVQPYDARFIEATMKAPDPLRLSAGRDDAVETWWLRLPRLLDFGTELSYRDLYRNNWAELYGSAMPDNA